PPRRLHHDGRTLAGAGAGGGSYVAGAGVGHRRRQEYGRRRPTDAMSQAPELSVIVPVFNEVENISPLWRELDAVLGRLGRSAGGAGATIPGGSASPPGSPTRSATGSRATRSGTAPAACA